MLIVALSSASAEPLEEPIILNCSFSVNLSGNYVCRLSQIEVLDPNRDVSIVGQHIGNRTNDDVQILEIRNSNTPFMIQQIFSTFPNIFDLDVQTSNLKSIDIPDSAQLFILVLGSNNISRISNGTFISQKSLQTLIAIGNEIEEIEEDAFLGLASLTTLDLNRNKLSQILLRTLNPLVNVVSIDLRLNLLTSIDNLFSTNKKLFQLFLGDNQVKEISPQFTSVIKNSLGLLNLLGNECINKNYVLSEEIELIVLHNELKGCFNNFVGDVPEKRRITLEFEGPMDFFDEFGNVVAKIGQ